MFRRKGLLDDAYQQITAFKHELDPDLDREIYQVLLVEEQSILFDRGLLLEVDEVNDEIITNSINYPIENSSYIFGTRFLMQGILLSKRGDQQGAINQFLHSVKIFDNLKTSNRYRLTALAYNNAGYSYTLLGDINQAIHYYKLSAEVNKNENPYDAARTYANLGLAYSYIADYETAIKNLESSVKLLENLDNPVAKSLAQFNFIFVYCQKGELDNAEISLNKLHRLKCEVDNVLLSRRYDMARAIYRFHLPTFSDKAAAYELFDELIEDRVLLPFYKKLAYSYQAEILLQEIALFGTDKRINEIVSKIDKMGELANTEQSAVLKVNTLILRIQFLLLQGKFKEAQELREEVNKICDEKNLVANTLRLQYYLNYIFQARWNIDQSIASKIKDLSMVNILQSIRTDQFSIPMTTEIPVMFMLIGPNGNVQDQILFTNSLKGNEHLIGSFINAINIFFQDTMKDQENIEQINSREYSIFIRPYEQSYLVYILKGIFLNVSKKMMRIALRLQERDFARSLAIEPNLMLQVEFDEEVEKIIREEILRDIIL